MPSLALAPVMIGLLLAPASGRAGLDQPRQRVGTIEVDGIRLVTTRHPRTRIEAITEVSGLAPATSARITAALRARARALDEFYFECDGVEASIERGVVSRLVVTFTVRSGYSCSGSSYATDEGLAFDARTGEPFDLAGFLEPGAWDHRPVGALRQELATRVAAQEGEGAKCLARVEQLRWSEIDPRLQIDGVAFVKSPDSRAPEYLTCDNFYLFRFAELDRFVAPARRAAWDALKTELRRVEGLQPPCCDGR